MTRVPLGLCARTAAWWIKRNPMYLLSAAAMAVGAKLYLSAPDARAGDVGLILLTLGVLQAYELAVAGVLILLHRRRRSPEDQPSLLLVAALFWTGPLAATLELSQHDGPLGTGFAAAACIVALSEFVVVRRAIGLRMSWAGQLAAALCLMLVTAAPLRLRIAHVTAGTDEIALYACWWLLAMLALLALPAVRWHARRGREPDGALQSVQRLRIELAFLATVVVATATHLYAMNYAFYGHARAFYGVPLLGALAVVGFECAAIADLRRRFLSASCAALPVVGVLLAWRGFRADVPIERLPLWLRDPVLSALLVAAVVWWYGYLRQRWSMLLHAGSVAVAAALLRAVPDATPSEVSCNLPFALPLPVGVTYGAAVVTAYLLVTAYFRRSRLDLLTALAIGVCAIDSLVLGRVEADRLICLAAAGWAWLLAIRVLCRRPGWFARTAPVVALVVVSCYFELHEPLRWIARSHAIALTAVLITVGWLWPASGYRLIGGLAGGSWLLWLGGRSLVGNANATAAMTVAGAFLLLAVAVLVSWYKQRLLGLVKLPTDHVPPE